MKLVLVFLFTTLFPTQAEWSSFKMAMNPGRAETNSFEGVIKTIYVDEASDRLTVRVKASEDNKAPQEFFICDESEDVESEKVSLVRKAFSTGTPVRLGFGGAFDRCLSSIKYLKESAPQQVGI